MLELLFLLLPIAAAYGWYMGKRSARFEKHQQENRISREFVTGVNFLLSDQKEEALELFSAIAKEKGDDFEAHLTLGNLLRSRGQIDSALQIHESIIASELLTFEQRLLIKQHLGKTYLQAGLLDRAEAIFISLLEEDEYRVFALKQLLTIYQSTREWEQAIVYAQTLLKLSSYNYRTMIGHFYCELALKAELELKISEAYEHLKNALRFDKNCARASLMLGQLYVKEDKIVDGIMMYQYILYQDPLVAIDVLPILDLCYDKLEEKGETKTEFSAHNFEKNRVNLLRKFNLNPAHIDCLSKLDFLKKCIDKDIGSDAHVYYINYLIQQGRNETAYEHLKTAMFKRPTLKLFKAFINFQLTHTQHYQEQSSLTILRDMLNEQIINKPKYRCISCGFNAHSLYWHCPSCRNWSTISIIKNIEGQ
ncbi:lipopolysaccharide assembly protein LapB [Thorsellia anophelis]|uniref:Lipopolysaccharide assembly protein B n=1 Tax=Thorsellia anophelis DSM 18579 TaxID=1123402 RepID=A0A1I0BYG6_9GAMM|nr:lipopolysaccharide assembly protein LapB [Thorsellia anophelis]SET12195.1 Lipopolysaccharide biosynthesis regulator YciM, contains six TPR domains and a predicted metal-binding C-terminal domain [Thorsellia anophelis DSM 18579]